MYGKFANSGKIRVLFTSNPVEIPNDYVWIFAGGAALNAFLIKIGVRFGDQYRTESGDIKK
jgi:hypothetical protein